MQEGEKPRPERHFFRARQGEIGIRFERGRDRRDGDVPKIQALSAKWSVDRLTGDVVPIRVRFVIDEEDETVIETTGAEMVELAVHDRRQTDATMADGSEADEIGLAFELALR